MHEFKHKQESIPDLETGTSEVESLMKSITQQLLLSIIFLIKSDMGTKDDCHDADLLRNRR